MFFILSKVFLMFLYPFTWFILCLAGFLFFKKEKWKKRSKIGAIVIFLVFSNTAIYLECIKRWEIHGTRIENVKNYDVGIVLGGMFEYNADLDVICPNYHADRIFQAINLYKKGKIKKILISGDSGYVTGRGLKEALQVRELLIGWGIPAIDLLVETKSKNTHENATETKKVLQRSYPHLEKRLLITSGMHIRRARACFLKENFPCDTYSTDLLTGPTSNYFWDQYIIPDWSTLFGWNKMVKEWIGYAVYDMTGYI